MNIRCNIVLSIVQTTQLQYCNIDEVVSRAEADKIDIGKHSSQKLLAYSGNAIDSVF